MKREFNKFFSGRTAIRILMPAIAFGVFGVHAAFAGITITRVTWNVIGLDSNNVSVGPNVFPVGARVCNTGGAAVNNVVSRFVWDGSNAYINLDAGSADTQTLATLAAGACADFYYDVAVTRTPSAYNATRRFHITAVGDGAALVSTPQFDGFVVARGRGFDASRRADVSDEQRRGRHESRRRRKSGESRRRRKYNERDACELEHDDNRRRINRRGDRFKRQFNRRRFRL